MYMTVADQKKFSHALAVAAQKVYWNTRRGVLMGETQAQLDAEYGRGFMSAETYANRLRTVSGGTTASGTSASDVQKALWGIGTNTATWLGTGGVLNPVSTAQYGFAQAAGTTYKPPAVVKSTFTAAGFTSTTPTAPAKDTSGSTSNSWATSLTDSLTGLFSGKSVTPDFKLEPTIIQLPQQPASATPWGTIALIGGGVLAAGVAAYFLLRKK